MKRSPAKPKFVREIEEHLGLKCKRSQLDGTRSASREWLVLSPTGVVLFRVSSVDGEVIGGVGFPSMYTLQGLAEDVLIRRIVAQSKRLTK